jgi:hypothetical protein
MMHSRTQVDIENALRPIKHRLLHPEEHDQYGKRIYQTNRFGVPLQPQHRLSARLTLLCELRRYELELLKEVMADRESIQAAALAQDDKAEVVDAIKELVTPT